MKPRLLAFILVGAVAGAAIDVGCNLLPVVQNDIPPDVKAAEAKILSDLAAGDTFDQIVADVAALGISDAIQFVADAINTLLKSKELTPEQTTKLTVLKFTARTRLALRGDGGA